MHTHANPLIESQITELTNQAVPAIGIGFISWDTQISFGLASGTTKYDLTHSLQVS